jgi:hypothetical protein
VRSPGCERETGSRWVTRAVGHGLREAVGHGLRSCRGGHGDGAISRVRERDRLEVGHGCERRWVTVCDLQIGDGEISRSGARARSARGGGVCARRGRLGVAGGSSLEEQKKRAEREKRVREHRREIFGKWFTENFSVNRFPNFSEEFSGQLTNDFR